MPSPAAPSVTVTVTRRASPGRHAEMAAWVQATQRLASGFPGFLGAGHIRPGPDSQDWHMRYRFADEPIGRVLSRSLPAGPPRWKQAVVIFLSFLPTDLAAQALLLPWIGDWPLVLRVLTLTAVLIPIKTYLVLPFVTRRLQWWLGGRPGPWRRRSGAGRE